MAGTARADVKVVTPSGSFWEEQRRVLEGIATGAPLTDTLTFIVRIVEREVPGVRASILLVEGDHLRHGAAPSLPESYNLAIDGLAIGPNVGSCGAAAATQRAVIIEDVRTHPNWVPFLPLVQAHQLRACWSTPIFGRSGECVGTFALYPMEARGPTSRELSLVGEATHLASVAIQHERLISIAAKRQADLAQRARLREFFRSAPVPLAILMGRELRFDFANEAYERMVNRRNIVGRTVADVFPELEGQGILALLQHIYETGAPFEQPQMRVELERGRGAEECFFDVRIEPYREEAGQVIGVVAMAMEVTEQVRTRLEIDTLRADLGQREKMSALGQLVSGVAHEIRTPLTYLTTNLNLVQMRLARLLPRLPPAEAEASRMLVEQYVPSAIEAADRINHLVEDLRAFTQLRAASRDPASVREVVDQAIHLFRATQRGRVTVEHEAEGDALLVMDKLQVQQALLNLLQNALEAEPRDHRIVVRTEAGASGARILVADTGRGIPPEAQSRIFDPFFTTRTGGTGLGLSIVKRIVDEHGGRISFETSSAGTTFLIELVPDGRRNPP